MWEIFSVDLEQHQQLEFNEAFVFNGCSPCLVGWAVESFSRSRSGMFGHPSFASSEEKGLSEVS